MLVKMTCSINNPMSSFMVNLMNVVPIECNELSVSITRYFNDDTNVWYFKLEDWYKYTDRDLEKVKSIAQKIVQENKCLGCRVEYFE